MKVRIDIMGERTMYDSPSTAYAALTSTLKDLGLNPSVALMLVVDGKIKIKRMNK